MRSGEIGGRRGKQDPELKGFYWSFSGVCVLSQGQQGMGSGEWKWNI